tara:strand:- start:6254 stop:7237 length:984 start_codon:yes stop_codon:yes gene_type:complete
MKYPDYVTSKRGQIIFRFLSNLADHYNKNTFWIKSQYGLYLKKFKNIPENWLMNLFQDYLINEMEWLPTIKKVSEYMTSRHDFQMHWHSVPLDQTYCENCRTDSEGKEGGFREVYFYGFRQSLNKKAEAHYKGSCNCTLASKSNHKSYLEIMDWMRAQDNFGEIHCSYFDPDSNRIVTAQEQSKHHWDKKIAFGIIRRGDPELGEDEGAVFACWDHPLWISVYGEAMCERYGIEMPPEIVEKFEKTRRDIKGYTAGRNIRSREKVQSKIDEDPRKYAPPVSLADAMGGSKVSKRITGSTEEHKSRVQAHIERNMTYVPSDTGRKNEQ